MKQHKTKACGIYLLVAPLNTWSSHKTKCIGNLLLSGKCLYETKLMGSLKKHTEWRHMPNRSKKTKKNYILVFVVN